MSDQQRPAEPGATGEPAERLAEILAWHGMARYADPDDLGPYVRPARGDGGPAEPAEPAEPAPRTARSPQ